MKLFIFQYKIPQVPTVSQKIGIYIYIYIYEVIIMKHIFYVYICLLSSILNQIISSSMINPSDFRPEWPNNIISGLTYSQVHVYTVLLLCFISIALRYTIFHKTLFTNYLYDNIYYMLFSYQTLYTLSDSK
jgi:hypothetical protein